MDLQQEYLFNNYKHVHISNNSHRDLLPNKKFFYKHFFRQENRSKLHWKPVPGLLMLCLGLL